MKLSKSMTLDEFNNGYWYIEDVKLFAKDIGIAGVTKLRKDELEDIIKHYLETGEIKKLKRQRLRLTKVKDVEKGLKLSLQVVYYTNDFETKNFIDAESKKLNPEYKRKSGSRYRLNRWREEQMIRGKKITYDDLVRKNIELNRVQGKFPQAPSGRYINFLSDFLANQPGTTNEDAIAAWQELKKMNTPKTYRDWKAYKAK